VQHRKIACICPFLRAYSKEWAWKAVGDRLQGPCYLSRDDCDWKIKARKQRTDIGKYSFVNSTIKLEPTTILVEALAISPIDHILLKRVIVSEVKLGALEGV
jgi:hypothetical protein